MLKNFISKWIKVLWCDFWAWRKGLIRCAPRFAVNGEITRGRIYKSRQGDALFYHVGTKPKIKITAKHIKADGTIEYHIIEN